MGLGDTMKLVKFLNRHVFTSIILYFMLMVGVAWAVSEHIAARTKLAVMPADDDVLAIYDTNAGTGLGIEVSVFRGDNLNAIVNASTGVPDDDLTVLSYSGANPSSNEVLCDFVMDGVSDAEAVIVNRIIERCADAIGAGVQ